VTAAVDLGPLEARTLGDFVLRERIGAGGFGDVYLAEQIALKREAIVKVLRTEGSYELRVAVHGRGQARLDARPPLRRARVRVR
jgi:serine/threonine-protein kinase